MRKYVVSTVGLFLTDDVIPNGQCVRTSMITETLEREYGKEKVYRLSYRYWKKHPVSLLIKLVRSVFRSENLLIFPDQNAIKVLAPVALMLCKLSGTKLHYNVIGGWLPTFTEKKNFYTKVLRKFDTLFVQTSYLKNTLNGQGINNVKIFPNFKPIEIVEKQPTEFAKPYRCFFLSRVMKEKGIEELIEAIKEVNREKVKFELDIFGPFDHGYETEFRELEKGFPYYIKYKGSLDPKKTSHVLNEYFLQVFPTKYKTEGFPGCVIDSFAAGVPVLASHWDSFDDVIAEGVTGFSFDFDSRSDLIKKLNEIYDCPEKTVSMRENCVSDVKRYLPENVIRIMTKELKK